MKTSTAIYSSVAVKIHSVLLSVLSTMAASYTDNPTWVKKIKQQFTHIDIDNDGRIDNDDIATMAKKI